MPPEMVSTGSVSSFATAHRCSPFSSATASDQGLTLVHYSAQLEPFLT